MKYLAALFLFFFIAFLSAPTLICMIEKNADISVLYDSNEEEIQKNYKEIKANLKLDYEFAFFEIPKQNLLKIISENLSKHDNVFEEIFSPPPEFI